MRALGFSRQRRRSDHGRRRTWGALVVALRRRSAFPLETERRLQAFAELVGLAVASASARDELAASRLRIVEASDTERRRIERNLHDGAQQRLVALSLGLRLGQEQAARHPDESRSCSTPSHELAQAIAELRELAQGIHPAVLTERGLGTALEVLAARYRSRRARRARCRSACPSLWRPPTYYTVSEALANVVKHAHAVSARVRVACFDGRVEVEISDDGVGGADADHGSGLPGLRDRVEALDGRLSVESSVGEGTVVRAQLPVRSRRVEVARSGFRTEDT